jgi:RNA polymerase sigma factor (sigma-70 family)
MEDQELVSRVLLGETQAFRLLIKQHEKLVAHMIGRIVKHDGEREDLCQDVFIRVYEKLKDFTFQSKLSTWIATIAYRYAINHLRKKRLVFDDFPEEDRFDQSLIENDNPETLFSERNMDDYVMKLVDKLPTQYKTVLLLYHVDNMNYLEIGEITGMPEGTVKNYIFRARKLLKESVIKHFGKEEIQ